jgi:nitrate reductase NapAB chaperone NapD
MWCFSHTDDFFSHLDGVLAILMVFSHQRGVLAIFLAF